MRKEENEPARSVDAIKKRLGGNKHDQGKPMVGVMLRDFSRALTAVAEIFSYGCSKYGFPSGWEKVTDASNRYEDALGRHLLANATKETDEESEMLHLAHAAWNMLCILELRLRDIELDKKETK